MSNIRFMKVAPYYYQFVDQFYKRNSGLEARNFLEQYEAIMRECFGWADFWKINLESKGYFKVEEVIMDVSQIQKQWAKEHHIDFDEDNWKLDILEAQISEFKPEILFTHDHFYITPEFRKKIKKKNPELKCIIGWDGIGLNDIKRFEGCDIVASCSEYVVDFYLKNGIKALFFANGFEKSILARITPNPRTHYNATFVGSVMLQNEGHNKRFDLLSALTKKIDMDIFLSSFFQGRKLFAKNQINRLLNRNFREFIDVNRLNSKNKGEAFGLKMYQILHDSKITLNTHIDTARKGGNLRLYEATGVGTCLVTDWKENLNELFEIDKEVVAYRNADECVEKVRYLLNNEKELVKIATAGQKKTLEKYTLAKRLEDFSKEILNLI